MADKKTLAELLGKSNILEKSDLAVLSRSKITLFDLDGSEKKAIVFSDNNYGYIGDNFLYISPQGFFSLDEFNPLLFTNTSDFPIFLDGEYLAISKNGDESDAKLISLADSEKDYILPHELFTVESENSDIFQIESIKYGFVLSLQK